MNWNEEGFTKKQTKPVLKENYIYIYIYYFDLPKKKK